jgi:hypothetical protein
MSTPLLASHFPEDPIMVLRAGWQFLATYYAVALVIVFVLWRLLKASRFAYWKRGRVIIAGVLAVIFAPSEVSDFFLFNLPGPAVLGLVLLLISLPFWESTVPSAPPAFLDWHMWALILGCYILPLLITFAVAYGALTLYARSHAPASSHA